MAAMARRAAWASSQRVVPRRGRLAANRVSYRNKNVSFTLFSSKEWMTWTRAYVLRARQPRQKFSRNFWSRRGEIHERHVET